MKIHCCLLINNNEYTQFISIYFTSLTFFRIPSFGHNKMVVNCFTHLKIVFTLRTVLVSRIWCSIHIFNFVFNFQHGLPEMKSNVGAYDKK